MPQTIGFTLSPTMLVISLNKTVALFACASKLVIMPPPENNWLVFILLYFNHFAINLATCLVSMLCSIKGANIGSDLNNAYSSSSCLRPVALLLLATAKI